MLISFVIPVYNTEFYLKDCVNSILSQTFKDYEIVLVDDGSTDSSPSICDELSKSHSNIKTIHQLNKGSGEARNTGLNASAGDYIFFIDSDDFLKDNECIQKLSDELLNKNYPEILLFNLYYYYQNEKRFHPWKPFSFMLENECEKNSILRSLIRSGEFPISSCTKLHKRSFIIHNNLFFSSDNSSEDILWTLRSFSCSNSIRISNIYVYCYRKNVTTSKTSTFTLKKYEDLFLTLKEIVNLIQSHVFDHDLDNEMYSYCAYWFFILAGTSWNLKHKERSLFHKRLFPYKWLTKYNAHPKVKLLNRLYRYTGYHMTSLICFCYLRYTKR